MLLLGSDPLTRFINRAADTPFMWGRFDCLLWLADLIAERRSADPATDLRGSYTTMLGAAKLVRDSGGMVALVESRLNPLGIKRAAIPARGDIAVVRVAGVGGEHFGYLAGGIMLTGSVALLCQDGVLFPRLSDVPPIATWRV